VKIKLSFITNSSSSVFIIFVPEDFTIDNTYLSNLVDRIYRENINENPMDVIFGNNAKEDIMEQIQTRFEEFKEGEQYTFYECEDCDFVEWCSLLQICEDHSLILTEVDLPGPGSSLIKSLTNESIMKTLINYVNLEKFMQPFLRENKNDTENTKD